MRVAAFQRFPVFDDPERAAGILLQDLLWADGQGIDLAVFSESCLQGHSYDRDLIESRALSLEDPLVLRMLERFASVRTTAVIGFFERRGGAVFNSAMVLQQGRLAGVYAKAFPLEDGCASGTDFPVWHAAGKCFGINICNDLNYSEAARRLVDQGASIICAPINMMLRPEKAEWWREPSIANLRRSAAESGCWLIGADISGYGRNGWMAYGCTSIISPDGTVMARAAELAEDVVLLDIA